jgi:beta-phosphoglucomutase-like phosphatase (HAD superfamily)
MKGMPASQPPAARFLRDAVPPFRAAIFDCDGTLADTMPLHYQAWVETLERQGAALTEALFYELGGVPTAEITRLLNERFGYGLDVQATSAAKEARYAELLPRLQPVEPVLALAREYRGRYPLAVASGGLRRLVAQTLEVLEIADWFPVVCTTEDVAHGKPAPDLFLLAAERLGVPPHDCVVFEDADLGLEAARRAGMQAVDVRPWVRR